MSTSQPSPLLDHIVFFCESLEDEALRFLSLFTITPGGTHSDQLTANKLLLLENGVYLELVAFTPLAKPSDKVDHWLASAKPTGFIDWVLSPSPITTLERVKAINAAGGKEVYCLPVAGGRKTADGKMLQWETSAPVVGNDLGGGEFELRGRQPFWCEDVSPRSFRVPAVETPHPNGATHIKSLTLLSAPSPARLASYIASLSLIMTPTVGQAHQFEIGTPSGINVKLLVREASGEEEIAYVKSRGEGLWQVVMGRSEVGLEQISLGAAENGRIVVE